MNTLFKRGLMFRNPITIVAGAILLAGIGAIPVAATRDVVSGGGATLKIELNAASQREKACRLSFVLTNGMQRRLANLVLELVVFDRDGKVLRLLSASFGAMPTGKTRLKQYDVRGLACKRIGHVLLNDVTTCKGENLTPEHCTAAVQTSTRAKIPFEF